MNTDTAYITTPIYYVNDKPHIGHAYSTTLCDVSRVKRRNAQRMLELGVEGVMKGAG